MGKYMPRRKIQQMLFYSVFISAIFLVGCTPFAGPLHPSFVADKKGGVPSGFFVCHGHNCKVEDKASLSSKDWRKIGGYITTSQRTAQDERLGIARAIAVIEQKVGVQTGTADDRAGTGFPAPDISQMDCVSEAVNTTRYLKMMEKEGWLKFHTVEAAARRGYFSNGMWPHNAAVIKQKKNNQSYAVDSWFFANGVAPVIVPLSQWKAGWRVPEDKAKNPIPGPDGRYIY